MSVDTWTLSATYWAITLLITACWVVALSGVLFLRCMILRFVS